jgi:hypothetical protein
MGIADSEGKIHDFQGPYTVIVDDFAFGRPTRYLGLNRLIGQILAIERGQSYWNGMGQCNPGRQSNLLQAHGTLFVLGSCLISALSMLGQLPFVCCFCAQSDAIRLRMAALERCYIGLGHAHPWSLHWVCLIVKTNLIHADCVDSFKRLVPFLCSQPSASPSQYFDLNLFCHPSN